MCKYCKRLKQLKDLDEKRYKEIISAWRSRDRRMQDLLEAFTAVESDDPVYRVLVRSAKAELSKNYVGK